MIRNLRARGRCALVVVLSLGWACGTPPPAGEPDAAAASREAAYRANNRGVALLEQFAHESAVEAFREALALDASMRLARLNLPIALFYAGMIPDAAAEAAVARDRYPDAPQAEYLLGLIARVENRPDDALASFRRVLELDPEDVGALVNLALVFVQQRDYPEAASLSERALALEPYNATAAYNLAVALTRSGEREAGLRAMENFQVLRNAQYAVTYSQAYLEQGRYAEAVASAGSEPGLVDSATPAARFTDATTAFLAPGMAGGASASGHLLGGGVTLVDIDRDRDLDLIVTGSASRLLRNDGGMFSDVTGDAGLGGIEGATGVVAGDVDNDSSVDLLFLAEGGPRLFVQGEHGVFAEVRDPALAAVGRQAVRAAALVDVDHDGDLDMLIGGLIEAAPVRDAGWEVLGSSPPAASRLLRNNGDGSFEDITGAAGLEGVTTVVAVAPTDYDNRRDVDLVMVSYGARPKLFRNLRTGAFADVAEAVGLPAAGAYTAVALGDVNKDGFTDAFFGRDDAPALWALSDGRGRFRVEEAPAASAGATSAQVIDYDNDGLLDLLAVTAAGPRLFRNVGDGWRDESGAAFASGLGAGGVTAIAAGDIDLDGDTDIVARLAAGPLQIWRNDGGGNGSLRVALDGLVSNRIGVGAKVEIRAGSLHQKVETASTTPPTVPADVVFGLGRRTEADIVRVLWPSGILQAETAPPLSEIPATGMVVEELNRRPSSCPFLFAWNGDGFEFITDFMGGGEMGYWQAPGVTNVPDPEEYVRLTDRQLRARDGRFEIRVTNELEEVLFVDRLQLLAVTHPADVTVFPDEGLRARPRPFRLYATRAPRPLAGAWDDHGHDVLDEVSDLDRRHPDDFDRLPFRGYAREHGLTLELPIYENRKEGVRPLPGERTVLLLTGWTEYALSSDNVAASQAGLSLSPPALQAIGDDGAWRTVDADMGFPVGRPQTLVVDVEPYLSHGRRLRIVTNMPVYWDQIRVATATTSEVSESGVTIDAVPRVTADLRWRGFSTWVSPDGLEPFTYDYARAVTDAPWKLMSGRYTREGRVDELIGDADDRFVVSRSGDELALAFDAGALPALPHGMQRTFLLHSVGYSKEMNLHSASPDQVMPIPFRDMSGYPYIWPEQYPHADDLERFNTRVVTRQMAGLYGY